MSKRIGAVAFDAFALFDARPVFQACEAVAPGKGNELATLWRTRQFEYQWLRALGGRYEDFYAASRSRTGVRNSITQVGPGDRCTRAAHAWLSRTSCVAGCGCVVACAARGRHESRPPLKRHAAILTTALKNSDLDTALDQVISTDRIRSYKPDPRAYQLGVDLLQLPKERIAFVAFAGWDVAGAKWFGYPTFWNNRQSAAPESLGVKADAEGVTLDGLLQWLNVPASRN
jgi:2-haloacid dehalogenase